MNWIEVAQAGRRLPAWGEAGFIEIMRTEKQSFLVKSPNSS